MKSGVKISKQRLQEALNFRIRTQAWLAGAIDVDRGTISHYLAGTRSPSEESFERLCLALGMPKSFFLQDGDLSDFDQSVKLWRSLNSATGAQRRGGESVMRWQIEVRNRFAKLYDIPIPNFPVVDLPRDFRHIKSHHIEDAATKLREHWGLGTLPIRNLLRSAERAGVVVSRFNLHAEKLDAVSTKHKGVPYVLLNSHKQSGVRGRFDLAHELGHLLLHDSVRHEDLMGKDQDALGDEKPIFHKIEGHAHRFAGALLLPERAFTSDIWAPTIQCFTQLKEKWMVSIQAMMRRCYDLEIINERQYLGLNVNITRKNYRKTEPLDEVISPEMPRLFPKCLEKLEAEQGAGSLEEFLLSTGLPSKTVEELCGVEQGYFKKRADAHEEAEENIVIFRKKSSGS